jgi:hypothetical protein
MSHKPKYFHLKDQGSIILVLKSIDELLRADYSLEANTTGLGLLLWIQVCIDSNKPLICSSVLSACMQTLTRSRPFGTVG